MKVYRSMAVAIMVALGFKTAEKWPADKLAEKVNKLNEQVDADTKLDDAIMQGELTKILKKIAAEQTVTIIPDVEEDAPAPAKPAKAPAKAAPAAEAEEAAPAKAPAKPAKPTAAPGSGKTTTKAPKAAKEPRETIPGVRNSRSRPYLAGLIIKKHTRDAGITDVMVKELDAAYGKENPAESLFCLRNAWHAIRGYNTKNNEGDLEQAAAVTEE